MIRGIAILLVVLVHSSQMVAFPGALANVTSLGRYGVPLFFILSGFLMGSLHGVGTDWSLRSFISRRAGRLLPAWWTFLALWLLAFALFPEEPFALAGLSAEAKGAWIIAGVVLSFLLLNDLTPVTTNLFVPGGWSISAEAIHYSLFPRLRQLSNRSIATIALITGGGQRGCVDLDRLGSDWLDPSERMGHHVGPVGDTATLPRGPAARAGNAWPDDRWASLDPRRDQRLFRVA